MSSLPPSVSETEFVRICSHIAKALFKKFGSIAGSAEDFEQEVFVWSLQALPKYDPARPLDGFLYTNARRRAINTIRDNVQRKDATCARCHAGTPCGTDGGFCPKYRSWLARNQAKASLFRPLGLDKISEEQEPGMKTPSAVESQAEGAELFDIIDERLPVHLRGAYLRMLAGDWSSVSPAHRRAVQREIATILREAGVENIDFEALIRRSKLSREGLRRQKRRRETPEVCERLGESFGENTGLEGDGPGPVQQGEHGADGDVHLPAQPSATG